MRDEGDRFVAWRLDDSSEAPGADELEEERMERALLAYAHRSAARVGAEWFAAEFARREEEERLDAELAAGTAGALAEFAPTTPPEMTLIDASVEDAVLGGAPEGLGLRPEPAPVAISVERVAEPEDVAPEPTPEPAVVSEPVSQPSVWDYLPELQPVALEVEPTPPPAIRHPHVPRPPAPDPAVDPKRRRRHRKQTEAPAPTFVISAPEWARMSPGARRLYGMDSAPGAIGTS